MKKVLLLMMFLVLIIGCKNKEENVKSNYLLMKSSLLEAKKFTDINKIPCDITVDVKRLNDEKVSYKVILSSAKEDLHDLKVIVVHNYYTENVFPSVGFFDKTKSLKTNDDATIVLKGEIETSDDIDKLNLELKILIQYKDNDNKIKDIYYKTT